MTNVKEIKLKLSTTYVEHDKNVEFVLYVEDEARKSDKSKITAHEWGGFHVPEFTAKSMICSALTKIGWKRGDYFKIANFEHYTTNIDSKTGFYIYENTQKFQVAFEILQKKDKVKFIPD